MDRALARNVRFWSDFRGLGRLKDPDVALQSFERLEDRYAQKLNEQEQLRLKLQKELIDLNGRIESQRLDSEVFAEKAAQNRKLRAEGLISQEHAKWVSAREDSSKAGDVAQDPKG